MFSIRPLNQVEISRRSDVKNLNVKEVRISLYLLCMINHNTFYLLSGHFPNRVTGRVSSTGINERNEGVSLGRSRVRRRRWNKSLRFYEIRYQSSDFDLFDTKDLSKDLNLD